MVLDYGVATVVAALAVGYVLYAFWQASGRAWPVWTLRLSSTRRAFVEWLRLNTTLHLETLAGALRVARDEHGAGREDKALRVIGEVDVILALHVRLLRAWLQHWSDLAGMLGVVPEPGAAQWPHQARGLPLRRLRLAGHVGELLLPTRSARFRLGVRIQRLALQCMGWRSGAARLRAQQLGKIGPALDELEATHAALVALDAQALTTLEHVLHALPQREHEVDDRAGSRASRP